MHDAPQTQPPAIVAAETNHPQTVEATGAALARVLSDLFGGPGDHLDDFARRYAARLLAEGIKREAATTEPKRKAAERTMRALKSQAIADTALAAVKGLQRKADELWAALDNAATFAAAFAPLAL